MEFRKHPERALRHFLSMPFIYSMIVPLLLLDLFLLFYHGIAFPLYGIEQVSRSKYIIIDRQKLSKLSPVEKLNCMYCGYANGLLPYAVEIAARTEQYWCGIKHAKYNEGFMPEHHKKFQEYNEYK